MGKSTKNAKNEIITWNYLLGGFPSHWLLIRSQNWKISYRKMSDPIMGKITKNFKRDFRSKMITQFSRGRWSVVTIDEFLDPK